MNYISSDNNTYILQLYLKEDSDLFSLKYDIDGKSDEIFLSNKGHHSIYLGHFSKMEIEDSKKVKFKLVKRKNNHTKFYENFVINVNQSLKEHQVIYNMPYLFEDLKENNGQNLYGTISRILYLTQIFNEKKEQKIFQDIKYSLDFIMNNWYTGKVNYQGNWWFYEIGVPRCLNEILYILRDVLSKDLIFKYLNIERFYIPSAKYIFYRRNYPNIYREAATCANLAENIYICTLREILHENDDALDELFEQVSTVIKTTDNHDGFYLDGSFIQHENIPYNASYGEVLLKSITRIMEIFKLLNYDCNDYIIKIENILLKSYEPFLYDGRALECVRGRAVSRIRLNSRYSYNNIMASIEKLYSMFPSEILEKIVSTNKNKIYSTYSKSFNYMDRYITRNNDYLISINLNSNYIANYESINDENLLGYYSSNYTYDLIYNNHICEFEYPRALYVNPFYRNGSTNSFNIEKPNYVYENNITAGTDMDNILVTCWHQNNDVKGYFSKCYLGSSLVCLGTNIESKYDYVSTIYNFVGEYHKQANEINVNEMKIVIKNDFVIEKVEEVINPKLNNVNEPDIEMDYITNRIYLTKPAKYEYQIYPKYKFDDIYEFYNVDESHIIKYKNYLLINSFNNNLVIFDNIKFKGSFSGILKFKDNKIYLNISTGKRNKEKIYFYIDNFNVLESDVSFSNNDFIIEDELVHKVIYRR